MECARADLKVVRLQDHAVLRCPVILEAQDKFLKMHGKSPSGRRFDTLQIITVALGTVAAAQSGHHGHVR